MKGTFISKVSSCAPVVLFLVLAIFGCRPGLLLQQPQSLQDLLKRALQLYNAGQFTDSLKKVELAISDLPKNTPDSSLASLYIFQALLEEKSGSGEKSAQTYEEAKNFLKSVRNTPSEFDMLATTLPHISRHLRPNDQRRFWEQLENICQALDWQVGIAFTSMQLAETHLAANNYEDAARIGMKALTLADEEGHIHLQVLSAITVSGGLLFSGRPKEAETILNKYLAKAQGDTRLALFSLAQMGLINAALGREEQTIEAFTQAVRVAQEQGALDLQAIIHLKFGAAYLILGNLIDSIREFTQAQRNYEKFKDELGVAYVEEIIAEVYFRSSKYEQARQHALTAVSHYQRIGNRVKEATNLRVAGLSSAGMNNTDEALESLEKAVYIQVAERDQKGALETFFWIIDLLKKAGRVADTRAALLTGLDTYLGVFSDPEGEAAIRQELAGAFRDLGFFSDALAEYAKVFRLLGSLAKSQSQVLILVQMSIIAETLKDYELYFQLLDRMIELGNIIDDPRTRTLLLNANARALRAAGDTFGAFQLYLQALHTSRQISKESEMNQLILLGWFFAMTGHPQKATDYLKEAFSLATDYGDKLTATKVQTDIMFIKATTETSENIVDEARTTLEAVRALQLDREYLWTALSSLVLAYRKVGDYQSAISIQRDLLDLASRSESPSQLRDVYTNLGYLYYLMGKYPQAMDSYKIAIEWSESLRVRVVDERQQMSFFATQLTPFDGMIDTLYAQYVGAVTDKSSLAEEALYYAESSKARTWADRLSKARLRFLEQAVPFHVLETERNTLQITLRAFQDYNSAKDRYGTPQSELKAKEAAFKEASKRWKSFKEELWLKYPRYASLRYPERFNLGITSIRDDETLIVYKVGVEWTYAWVIEKGDLGNEIARFVRLPARSGEITELVQKYLQPLRSLKYERISPEITAKLLDSLIKPVLSDLGIARRIVIIPDDVLALLPFEALIERFRRDISPGGAAHLDDQATVSYYPSAIILSINRKSAPAMGPLKASLFAVGDPIYGLKDERIEGSQSKLSASNEKQQGSEGVTRGERIRKGALGQGYSFGRLKHSGSEVLKISKLLNGGVKDILLGKDASERRVKSIDLSRYKYLHFAVHGILSYDIPFLKEPALVLSEDPEGAEDGFLTTSEIYGFKLNADLVTLSACETGLGQLIAGEGILGLSRAFMDAGARAVVVSLWEVADETTSLFMEQFYSNLLHGMDSAGALAKAKSHLRKNGYENPYYWAPFVLMGD